MSESLRVQLRVRVQKTRSGRKPSAAVINEAVRIWADTGEAPRGFTITGISWHNYDRKVPERSANDEESIEAARVSLHLAELLASPGGQAPIVQVGEG